MYIIIEIGTSEQKKIIEKELRSAFDAISNLDQDASINNIVVPVDFDATVNMLLGISSYRSVRNLGEHDVVVNAKVVNNSSGSHLVISPHIFNAQYDIQARYFLYRHELVHAVRKRDNVFAGANSIYTHNLEVFIDEYFSDRVAYEFVDQTFQTRSDGWQTEIARQSSQFTLLLANPAYSASLKSSIRDLQFHQDIMRFLQETHLVFDGIFLTLAHAFALSDTYPSILPLSELEKSNFVNARTMSLVGYAREHFRTKNPDLSDGISLMSNFMQNFGIVFEDSPNGLVCHVDYSDF